MTLCHGEWEPTVMNVTKGGIRVNRPDRGCVCNNVRDPNLYVTPVTVRWRSITLDDVTHAHAHEDKHDRPFIRHFIPIYRIDQNERSPWLRPRRLCSYRAGVWRLRRLGRVRPARQG